MLMMKQLIEDIVHALVDKPSEVQLKEVIGDHAHLLELRVAREDLGKVIGKGGAHASAIRTLMTAAIHPRDSRGLRVSLSCSWECGDTLPPRRTGLGSGRCA